jgi:hypothetical protein
MGNHDRLAAGFHFRGVLPHLKREGGSCFVTFRQAGTLPKELLLQLKREREMILREALAANRPLTWQKQEELFRWYSHRVDKYLDAGHGICYLSDPNRADLVASSSHAEQVEDQVGGPFTSNSSIPGRTLKTAC